MELVAARTGVGTHDSRHRLAELGIVVLGCDLGFFDCIETGIHNDDSEDRILVVGAIQVVAGAAEVLAVHENLLAALGIFRGRVAPSSEDLGSRRKQLQGLEITIVEGQFLQLLSGKLDRHIGAVRLELRSLCRDFDLLAGRTDLKMGVHIGGCVSRHGNVF